jgi:uncharacterized integral membrane protein
MWLLNAAIFFALFAFALNNQEAVTLHLFFGARWQAPLVLVLLCVLVIGVFLGVLVMLPLWLRARAARQRLATDAATHPTDGESSLMPPTDATHRHGI